MAKKEKQVIIIAMKGHPGTGKTTLAESIATALKLPLLDKDDVRDSTSTLQHTLPASSASKLLNDLSYDVVFRIASTQVRLGLSVIIDSPLSRRAHLDRLVHVASSAGARLLVVECKPKDEGEWRRRVEWRGGGGGGGDGEAASWHKPATWSDMERLLEGYGGSTDYDFGDVPRLVVDTTADVPVGDLVSTVVEFVDSHAAGSGGRFVI
ncbi:uncharacterized protein LOC126696768 [Quercus robur]|uniref:uncharacterized protein LOC126696768 n=1 Tax=Quercus robur TaxID=38942 RepID=UPI002161469C|nr:uncharacterized protein LOC126696768 [Quercus robur]